MKGLCLAAITLIMSAVDLSAATPLSIGEQGSIVIPFYNNSGSVSSVDGVALSVAASVPGINILNTSFLGPVSVFPGHTVYFHVDFAIGTNFNLSNTNAEIALNLTHASPSFLPASRTWVYKTQNLFKTLRGDCLEPGNVFCGEYLSPDSEPPATEIVFDGTEYDDASGRIYITPNAAINLRGGDTYLEDSNISGVAIAKYKIGAVPSGFEALNNYINPVTLPVEGLHTFYFASRDYAGNTEQIKSSIITVDGTAPGSPEGPKVEGIGLSSAIRIWKNVKEYNLSWNSPADVSGVAGARVQFGGAEPGSNSDGIFFAGTNSLKYSAPDISDGEIPIWLWLEDNVGNAAPASAVHLTLRYDGTAPNKSTVSCPEFSKETIVPVSFSSSDQGALTEPPTGSGIKETILWSRLNSGPWVRGESRAGLNGTFTFNTQGLEGSWEFYTQSFDNAGNSEPAPETATTTNAKTFVDVTVPALSGVKAQALSPSTAFLEWTTDDETTAIIDYGRTTSYGSQFREISSGRIHGITLTGLPNPADIHFKITATNKTGLSTIKSQPDPFKTPLDIRYTADIFGVIDHNQPVTVHVSNPVITQATLVVDGVTWEGPVGPDNPATVTVDPTVAGSGWHDIIATAGDYGYTSSIVVDNAVRTVKLARLVIDAGGTMKQSAGGSGVDGTFGQAAQMEMSSADSKLFAGYYAGIDPKAPADITDLGATPTPGAGQMTLSWTAPGDDGDTGTVMKYEIRYSPNPITAENFGSALRAERVKPLPATAPQSTVISGLQNGTRYYFAIKAFDELHNFGTSLPIEVFATTLYVTPSSEMVGDKPAVEVVTSFADVSITQIPPDTEETAFRVARAQASGQGLVFYGGVFDLNHPGTFTGEAQLYFRYTDPGDNAVENELAIYRYNPTLGEWEPLPSEVEQSGNVIQAITHSFSLYAVFGKDVTPPITAAQLSGGTRYADSAGNTYVSGAAKVMLTATDAGGGVARSEYRLDSAAGPFTVYAAPVLIPEGWHTLQFRSVDKAGNIEQAKSMFMMKDLLEPRAEINFNGDFTRLPGGVIHISSTSAGLDMLVLDQPASGSGLKSVRFELDGVVSEVQSQHSAQLDLGRHSIRVWAEDNVGNISETKVEAVVGDLLPPVVTAPINNFAAAESTITFTWQHQTTTFFSLTEYDLMLGSEPGFDSPKFTQVVSSSVKVTLLISEAGVVVQGLEEIGGSYRLITERLPDHLEGTLEGVVVSPIISLPYNTTSISGFTVIQSTNGGETSHEYSLAYPPVWPANPIADGASLSLNMPSGGWITFRSTLRRAALTDPSPTLTRIEFTVNYTYTTFYQYCYKPCYFCSYRCDWYPDYHYYNYQAYVPAANAVSKEGLRQAGDAVELITDYIVDQSTGPLAGTWLSQVYATPELAYRIGDFVPDYNSNGGTVSFEYSKSSGAFRPISELPALNVKAGDTIQFKAVLSRNSPNDVSPTLRGLAFNFILPPPTATKFQLPDEGKYYWRVLAKDYLGRFSAPSEERLVIYDIKPPVTDSLLGGATGQNGWYVSQVPVAFTSTDAVAGVQGTYYSVDGSSFTLYASPFALAVEGSRVLSYYSIDASGNKEAEKTFGAKIDLSSPTILASISPASNGNGWNNAPVSVLFSGTDTISGIAYCSSSSTVSREGVGQSVFGFCFDNAGLSSTTTLTINVDTTAPSLQYTQTPLANEYGWNGGSVTLKYTCADNLSGIRTCPADMLLSGEGLNLSTSAKVLDYADNSKTISILGINIDKTLPVSSAALAGTYKNGWYSSAVSFTIASTDSLSGIKETVYSINGAAFAPYPQQSLIVTADGASIVKYYAKDKAGNSELEKTIPFSIDRTPPQISYTLNPPPNPEGWNNSGVEAVFRGTDTLSGTDICTSSKTYVEGAVKTLSGWCRDMAGNQWYSTATVKIDLTSPTVYTAQSPLANADGWNNGPVTVIFSGDDQLSHIAYCTSAPPISDEGSGLAAGSCADKADNTTYASRTVNIDKTAPVTTVITSGTLAGDWYTTPAAITLAPADALSGVKQANYSLVRDGVLVSSGVYVSTLTASADGQYVVYYNSVDKAGNTEAGKSRNFKIDRSEPVISISSPAAGQSFIATRGNISVKFGVTDNLDPAPASGAWLEQVEDRGSPRGARPARLAVSDGQAIEPLGIDDGIWRLTVSATDFADNAALLSGGTFEVIHDVLAPRTGHSLTAGPSLVVGATTYIASAARLELTSIDDLVLAGDGIGLGVKGQAVRLWSGSSLVKELSFTNPAPRQGEAFTSSFTGAGLGLADGSYSLAYNAADVLGTVEAGRSIIISLDNTAPVSTTALAGLLGENDWHVSTVTVSLSAVDALSGVAVISYKLDNNVFLSYTSAFETAAEGPHTVKFYGKDRLGNTGTEKSAAFKIDRTAPAIVPERSPAANVHGWNNTGVTVSFTCSDAVSGVQFCPAEAVFSVEGFGQAVSGTVRDYADHASSAAVGGINIDKTQPASSLSVSGELWESGSDKYLTPRSAIALAATDGLSGVEAMEYHIDEAPFGVYSSSFSLAEGMRTVHYRAIDKADNIEATRTALYRVDGTGPATFLKAVGGSRYAGSEPGSFYASLASRFTLEAIDPVTNGVASGVRLTSWSDNGGAASNTTESLAFAEGRHVLAYWSMDNVDNQDVTKSTTILVDNTAPLTTHNIGSPYYAAGGVNYITPATSLTFTAADPVSGEVASGVSRIEVSLDGSLFGACSSELKFAEGRHTIKYRAVDNVGNVEAEKTLEVQSDNTVPVSGFVSSGQYYESLGRRFAPLRFTYSLTAADPVVGNVASGVKFSEYRIGGGAFTVYGSTFGLTEGIRSVEYRSHDNVTNTEPLKSATVYVDNTVPKTALRIEGGAQYVGPEPGSFYASLASRFTLEAVDPVTNGVASGVRLTSWSDNVGAASNTTESLAFAEGRHVLAYWSMDNVDSQEVTKSTTILVDNTAPLTTHNIGSPYYAAGGVNYITPATSLTFTAADPVSGEVASGVSRIEVSLDGSLFGAYSSVLKFNEGRHTIKYRAIDKVGNVEAERILEVQSDNTAPVSKWSASSGDHIERGNKFYLNALGRIAFESADPIINEVASGVEGIYYGIDAVPSDKYAAHVGLAEGVRTIKFSAKDNVGNTEVVKSTVIYVDGTKPITELSVSGDQYKSGRQYISQRTDILISAADPVVEVVAVGVKETKYTIDGGSYNDYSQFKLSAEGKRLVSFYSTDHVNNVEAVKTAELWVDGTAPLSVLDVLGGKQSPGAEPGSFYASLATKFGFMSIDPAVSDGAAGVKVIEYAVNGDTSVVYAQSITLGEGKHLITYRATDRVENTEVFRSTQIYIDNTAPATSFNIAGPLYIKDGIRHITPESELTFISADPLVSEVSAGVERIETAVDGEQWLKYTQALKFTEGRHTIKYRAIDNVGNMEPERVLEVRSDSTPPVTAQHIGVPYYISGVAVNYITPETPLTFSANDPVTSDVASGVEHIETAVDGAAYALYSVALKFPEGRHTIKYRAYDNVGNLEAANTLEVQSDATAPESRWLTASGPWIEKDNKFYLNTLGSIALESADPVENNVAAGLENMYYGIDAAPVVKYSTAFNLAEGVRTVNYSAKDNLGNTELVKSTVVYVDGTKPATALSLSGDQYNGDKQYVNQRTDIVITAADPAVNNVAVGVKDTKYSVDGAAFVNYSLFKLSAEGKRLVSCYSTDLVSNIEMAKTTALWVDNTPPSTELSIAGALYTTPSDEKLYITRDSGIVLTSSDPVSNDTASSVMLTKYRIDSGNWLVYSGSFTIAAEGLHTLEYYALDRVQNAEALRSAKIAVDNTPPVTGVSLGEPKSEVFGLPVIMQNTPITLTAADPVMSGVAAGLNTIFYEIENVQTGALAPVKTYTSPFTIPEQGTYIIRYWSKDNTGNLEIPKEKTAAVSTWRADGLVAASGLDMSGTADIAGTVKSNAVVSLGGNARILGDVTASTITLSGKAQITGQQVSGATPVNPVPIYLAGIAQSAAEANNNALVSAYLVDGKLVLASHTVITLTTGTYYFKGLELSGGSSITIAGEVDILVEGSISINGGSSMNASGPASGLSIVVSTTSEVKFNGGGSLAACLYAPYSDMKLTGNALLGGHYFVRTAAVSGTGNLIQSGEALPVPAPSTGGGPKTKASAVSTGSVGILAGPDPAFRLGEVYVFPNPAKGNEAPVFHIETGMADSVKITIYTISGRAAHEQILTGLPVELDDGNGLSYAYEYVWRGHIPSGVYLYSIEAQKAGQKLKKTGKFGVVR